MDAFLALRGLRTLDVRLERAQASAGELARRLDAHPAVRRVRYPGLPAIRVTRVRPRRWTASAR
jgi:cystathionine gamma-synthase